MGHRPELLEAWENLKRALLGPSSTLSPQLKEEVRRTLAQRTGCQFCASLGLPVEDHATRSESLAVAFADAVALDHIAITDAQVKLLLEEFTVPEIVELLMWNSFEYAGQMFGCLIGDDPAAAEEKRAFAASTATHSTGRTRPVLLIRIAGHQRRLAITAGAWRGHPSLRLREPQPLGQLNSRDSLLSGRVLSQAASSPITSPAGPRSGAAGFEEVGVQRRLGKLDGRWKDCVLVEHPLGPAAD